MVLNPPDDTVITRHPLANSIVSSGNLPKTKTVVNGGATARVLDA